MDAHSDLPLFQWRPPEVEIIPFPLTARVGRIREIADRFEGKTQAQREAYWRQVRDGQLRTLRKLGLEEERVLHEWASFFDAVQAELIRRSYAQGQGQPGGAA